MFDLNLSADKMENIKSPVHLRLEKMIDTLQTYREEYTGSRVPVFEQHFEKRKKKEYDYKRQ